MSSLESGQSARVPPPAASPASSAAPTSAGIESAPTLVVDSDAQIAEYGVLEQPGGLDLQALVELAALVCDVPNAAINLITSTNQHQVATAGIDPSVCAREDSMCAAVLDDPVPVVVPDASRDERFQQNPFVTGALGAVRFYASAPLVTPAGVTIGRLCVFDVQSHELTAERADVLSIVAARVVDVLELRLRTRQLEQSLAELTRTRDELHRSNELLSLFAGQVSHDLRSPLTAVLANTEMLSDEPAVRDDPELLQLAGATMAAGQRMAGMIDTILSYARSGGALESSDVDLDRVLDEVLSDLAPVVSERQAVVRRSHLPAVRGDARQLYSVLLNLVSNALKFTPPPTRPEIVIAADHGSDEWTVAVGDNGRGIPAERRESLFELYSRGDQAADGWGIGLATARRIVEAHGGRIGIRDSAARGAEVWFTLPG